MTICPHFGCDTPQRRHTFLSKETESIKDEMVSFIGALVVHFV